MSEVANEPTERCENCRYFERDEHTIPPEGAHPSWRFGWCRRFPKEIGKRVTQWCGEWTSTRFFPPPQKPSSAP